MNLLIKQKSGVASIPLVLGILVLTISIGLFISTVSLSDSVSSNNLQFSDQALEYAKIGAKDLLLRISREPCNDCSYGSTIEMKPGGCSGDYPGCVSTNSYPSISPTSSQLIIDSEGVVNHMARTVRIYVNLDNNYAISSYYWQ